MPNKGATSPPSSTSAAGKSSAVAEGDEVELDMVLEATL